MAPFASGESIKKNVSSCLTNLEYLDANIFQHCLYALFQGDVLNFDYHKPFDNVKGGRTVSPQHLVCHDGKWIMVSWDHEAKALRNFMPSRITNIKTSLVIDFHPVARNEIDLHLNGSYGVFKGRQVDTAVLLFSEQLSVWADKQFWHANAAKFWRENRLELHLPIASETGILQDILKYGANVEVLSPSSLRKNILHEIKKIQEYYQ
jgi:predicted DNA-binding transcriptional regulator YafY